MTRHAPSRFGFTLLEVLIAVVVLAFGLLGVVAVFPAVIDVQRRSQDAVLGGSLAASAEALINSSVLDSEARDWIDWESLRPGASGTVRRFAPRELLTNSLAISATGAPDLTTNTVELDFLWDSLVDADGNVTLGGGLAASDFLFDASGPLDRLQQILPAGAVAFDVGQRLLPDEASGDAPRYIWDVLVRRVDIGIGVPVDPADRSLVEVPISRVPDLPIELMVIVRPVDRGIRVPAGVTLRDTLRGYRLEQAENGEISRVALDDRDRRFPVAAAATDLATRQPGIALDQRGGQYSQPIFGRPVGESADEDGGLQLTSFVFGTTDPKSVDFRLRRPSTPPVFVDTRVAQREFAQVGQLFVSDRGTVHRVTRVSTDGDNDNVTRMEFEPPLSPGWRQIVFTPQVPADIRVIRTR
jgi:prepilin-type N-terminal cleavage/methylation domain-containing protein